MKLFQIYNNVMNSCYFYFCSKYFKSVVPKTRCGTAHNQTYRYVLLSSAGRLAYGAAPDRMAITAAMALVEADSDGEGFHLTHAASTISEGI